MALDDLVEDIEPQEVDEGAETQRAITRLEDLIKHYQDVVVKASDGNDPEGLSSAMIRLARINSSLGRHAAYASYIARNAERAYKAAREQYKVDAIDSGKSATFGDTQRYIKSSKEHDIFSDAQLIADQATDLCFRTDTVIRMAQSRLSLIKGDAARG